MWGCQAPVFTGKGFPLATHLKIPCRGTSLSSYGVGVFSRAQRNTKPALKQIFVQFSGQFNVSLLSLKRKTLSCAAPVSLKTPRLNDRRVDHHHDGDEEEDVIIPEESSTPKPSADPDVPAVKTDCIHLDPEEQQQEKCDAGELRRAAALDPDSERLSSTERDRHKSEVCC